MFEQEKTMTAAKEMMTLLLIVMLRTTGGHFCIHLSFFSHRYFFHFNSLHLVGAFAAPCPDACMVCSCVADVVDCSGLGLTEVPCNFPATAVEMFV